MSRHQPLAEGLKYAYVKGERRLASATTGKVLTKAEEAKGRAELKKKAKWDAVLTKYIDVQKLSGEDDTHHSGSGNNNNGSNADDGSGVVVGDPTVGATPALRVYTEAERETNIRALGVEVAHLRKAAYLAPQQKERKQTLDRLVSSLRSRGATVVIPGEDGDDGGGSDGLGLGQKRDREGADMEETTNSGDGDELDAEDEAALHALLRDQQARGTGGGAPSSSMSEAEALDVLREKMKQQHQDIHSYLYGGGGGGGESSSGGINRSSAASVMHMAGEMSAAHRIVSSQVNTTNSNVVPSYLSNIGAKPASVNSSFVPRSVIKKQQQQARVAGVAVAAPSTAATSLTPPAVVALGGFKGIHHHQQQQQQQSTVVQSDVTSAAGGLIASTDTHSKTSNTSTVHKSKGDDVEDLDSDLEDFLKELDDDE